MKACFTSAAYTHMPIYSCLSVSTDQVLDNRVVSRREQGKETEGAAAQKKRARNRREKINDLFRIFHQKRKSDLSAASSPSHD